MSAPAAIPRLQPLEQFIAGYIAPEYLVEGAVQRGRLYALTGRTGDGKTAICLALAVAVASARNFGGRATERGRVALFLGENPDDVRARLIMAAEEIGAAPAALDIAIFEGPFDLAAAREPIIQQLSAFGDIALIIIDTAAAFFRGDDENSNTELGSFARDCRAYTAMKGAPCVIIPWHPVKHAACKDQLLPRGGGAAIAEVDGNLCVWSSDKGQTTELHWTGKLRGPGFEPMHFKLDRRTSSRVTDAKGNEIPSVVAVAMTESDNVAPRPSSRSQRDSVLAAMLHLPGGSFADWCRDLGWVSAKGQPQKSRLSRALEQLSTNRLAENRRGQWTLTDAGRREAEKLQ